MNKLRGCSAFVSFEAAQLDRSNLLPPWLHFVLEKHQIYLDWLQRRRILRLAHSSAAALNQTTTTALQQQVPKKGLLAGGTNMHPSPRLLTGLKHCLSDNDARNNDARNNVPKLSRTLLLAQWETLRQMMPRQRSKRLGVCATSPCTNASDRRAATRIIAEYLDDMLDCQDILPSPELLCANQWADVDKFVDRMGDLQVLKHSSGVAAETPTTTVSSREARLLELTRSRSGSMDCRMR
jgi:hypothetical protein